MGCYLFLIGKVSFFLLFFPFFDRDGRPLLVPTVAVLMKVFEPLRHPPFLRYLRDPPSPFSRRVYRLGLLWVNPYSVIGRWSLIRNMIVYELGSFRLRNSSFSQGFGIIFFLMNKVETLAGNMSCRLSFGCFLQISSLLSGKRINNIMPKRRPANGSQSESSCPDTLPPFPGKRE